MPKNETPSIKAAVRRATVKICPPASGCRAIASDTGADKGETDKQARYRGRVARFLCQDKEIHPYLRNMVVSLLSTGRNPRSVLRVNGHTYEDYRQISKDVSLNKGDRDFEDI